MTCRRRCRLYDSMTSGSSSNAPAPRWNNALAQAPDPRDLRKHALIAAAGRAFGVKGFHNTTLDDVAQALGVTKPALYRYVKNKHEILYECHRLAIGMAEQALEEARARAKDPLGALRLFVAGYIRQMTGELGTCVVLTEYYSMTQEHSEQIQRRRRVVDTGLRQLVPHPARGRALAGVPHRRRIGRRGVPERGLRLRRAVRGAAVHPGLAAHPGRPGPAASPIGMLFTNRSDVCICGLGRSASLQMLAIARLLLCFAPRSSSRSTAHTFRSIREEHP